MTATLELRCRKPDLMLQSYLFAQAVADGQRVNWNDILTENSVQDLFVGLAYTVGHMRDMLANDSGRSLTEVDEQVIGMLLLDTEANGITQ